ATPGARHKTFSSFQFFQVIAANFIPKKSAHTVPRVYKRVAGFTLVIFALRMSKLLTSTGKKNFFVTI
ncbi:MAG: hypothetical protein KJO04_05845, partial [Bacteroidia bacterium]|nr:hypothetical protein [Bacteroidia bacterium]